MSGPHQYRTKPVVIEAMKLTERNGDSVRDWVGLAGFRTMTADVGDWIIKGVQGEVYPCRPDIFDATYELVE